MPRHLRLASSDWDRNMGHLLRIRRIGDVDDHRSVRLIRIVVQRVRQKSKARPGYRNIAVRTREGNPSSIRVLNDIRLVARPTLQVGMPDATHVLLLAALGYSGRQCAAAECQNGENSRG